MVSKSDVPLVGDGVPIRFSLTISIVEVEPRQCERCDARGETGSGWLDDDIETCPRCNGKGEYTRTYYPYDTDLERHLKTCMDDFLREKYVTKTL